MELDRQRLVGACDHHAASHDAPAGGNWRPPTHATGVAVPARPSHRPHALPRVRGRPQRRLSSVSNRPPRSACRFTGAAEDVTPRSVGAGALGDRVRSRVRRLPREASRGLFSILCSQYPRSMRVPIPTPARRAAASPRISRVVAIARRSFIPAVSATSAWTAVVSNRGFEVLADAGDIGGRHESSFGVDDRTTVERTLAWVDGLRRDDRFFF